MLLFYNIHTYDIALIQINNLQGPLLVISIFYVNADYNLGELTHIGTYYIGTYEYIMRGLGKGLDSPNLNKIPGHNILIVIVQIQLSEIFPPKFRKSAETLLNNHKNGWRFRNSSVTSTQLFPFAQIYLGIPRCRCTILLTTIAYR